ncbi:MAG: histidine kinase dimerization/phospho-acceptor domain-containing protein, partial [Dehalococcoidia bacterium]
MDVDSAETFSHRLREPLHSIIGFVKLILDGMVPSPEMQQEVLAIVYQQSEKLRTIIDELLESGIVKPMGMENPPIPIKEIVQEAVRRNKKFAAENEIGLKTEFSRELS